jgi:PelA/Pel-15E family pectate lyase
LKYTIPLTLLLMIFSVGAKALELFSGEMYAAQAANQARPITWDKSLKQLPEWYSSAEAARIADNVLLYQRNAGGWPKNIDMAAVLSSAEKSALLQQKTEADATIDNGATYTQLTFLARAHEAQGNEKYKAAFIEGFDYLITAQYENGGWPQYYPVKHGYYSHITYNDNAMVGVMKLMRDVAEAKAPYKFIDQARREKAQRAVAKGIECFLKTQVKVNGRLTVWCAQHDETTLVPAPARKFEPVSLSGLESVGIVRFLMGINNPDERIVNSIEGAVLWFEKSRIEGVRWIEKSDASKMHGFDRVLIKDTSAGPLWARFYEIYTNRPIFMGRDSVVHYDVSEIEDERRNGYQWYVAEPAGLLDREYPAWKKRMAKPSTRPVEH